MSKFRRIAAALGLTLAVLGTTAVAAEASPVPNVISHTPTQQISHPNDWWL